MTFSLRSPHRPVSSRSTLGLQDQLNFSTQSYTQLLRRYKLFKIAFSPVICAVHRHITTNHFSSSFILPSEVKQQHLPPSTSYVISVKAMETTAGSPGHTTVLQFCVFVSGVPSRRQEQLFCFHKAKSCNFASQYHLINTEHGPDVGFPAGKLSCSLNGDGFLCTSPMHSIYVRISPSK